jgi:hypothetical protein
MRRRLWENIAMATACPVIVLVLGLGGGVDTGSTVLIACLLALIAAAFVGDRWWLFRNFAERATLDDYGIEATPFYGPSRRMSWGEITVRQESKRRAGFHGIFTQIRLVGQNPMSRIVLDGEMPNFDELAEFVRSRTTHASPGPERRWWEKVFLPG